MIRVFLADDHAIVREGIKQILAEYEDIRVCGEAGHGNEVLRAVRAEELDALVLDMSMPGCSGVELIKEIRREQPGVKVLVLSMHAESQYAVRAIKAGAQGYVNKASAPEELVKALRRVAEGRTYMTDEVAERLVQSLSAAADEAPHTRLSDREYQIFLMLAGGESVGAIAERLHLSAKTVSTHKARILQKMGLANLAELIRYAVRTGLSDGQSSAS